MPVFEAFQHLFGYLMILFGAVIAVFAIDLAGYMVTGKSILCAIEAWLFRNR